MEPDDVDMKRILAYIFVIGIKSVFVNHMYRVGGKFYIQGDKGPIGLKATGSVARLIMIWWDRKFIEMLTTLGIIMLLYLRYIDDINLATVALAPGTYFDENTRQLLVNEDEINNEKKVPDDVRTLKVLRQIADSIVPMLNWEFDTPSFHDNNRLPVLDLNI